jgi:hypothetical protein
MRLATKSESDERPLSRRSSEAGTRGAAFDSLEGSESFIEALGRSLYAEWIFASFIEDAPEPFPDDASATSAAFPK